MIILITGGAKCGKSHIAEDILDNSDSKFYIATMPPHGEAAQTAIARHREMRKGKGFFTIEQQTNIGAIALPPHSSALLECVTTLAANEMFSGGFIGAEETADRVVGGIRTLAQENKLKTLVLVTNDVGSDGIVDRNYSPETVEYIKAVGEINRRLAEISDTVIEAVYGIPVVLKGQLQ